MADDGVDLSGGLQPAPQAAPPPQGALTPDVGALLTSLPPPKKLRGAAPADGVDLNAGLQPVGAAGVNGQSQPGVISRAWNWATKPMASPDQVAQAVTGDPNLTVDEMRRRAMELHPEGANDTSLLMGGAVTPTGWMRNYARSALAGMDASSAEEISKMFTSPLGIATMGLGPLAEGALEGSGLLRALQASRTGVNALKAARTGEVAANVGFGGQGAQQAYQAATDPNLSTPEKIAGVASGAGQAILGAAGAHGRYGESFLPTGVDTINRGMRAGVSGAKGLLDPLSGMSPADLIQKGAKPRNSIPNVEQRIAEAMPPARRAADQLGIDLDSPDYSNAHDEGLTATRKAKQNTWDTLEQNHLGPAAAFTRDTTPVADSIDAIADGMSDIAKRRDPALVESIRSAAKDYRGQNMSVSDMEQRIQELNNELYGAQSKLKVQQDTLRNDPSYGFKFAEVEGLRAQLNQALDEVTGPGAAELKRTYGSLKVLEDILERSRNVANRPSPVGIFKGLGRTAGAGNMAAGAWQTFTGHPEEGVPQALKGLGQWWYGNKAQEMNNRNFLVREAFKRTQPAGTPPGPNPNIPQAPPPTPPPGAGGAPPAASAAGTGGPTPPVPPVGPFARGAQPPPVAGEGTFRPATGTPEQAPLFTTPQQAPEQAPTQTPAPAGNVAPAAPESPRGALPKPTPKPPQWDEGQQAAVDEALAMQKSGKPDPKRLAELRELAYRPDRDPWQGKSSLEVHSKNGEFTPERLAHHDAQEATAGIGSLRGDENPSFVLLGGGAASGKSAVAKAARAKMAAEGRPEPVYVNNDDVRALLPENEWLTNADPLGASQRTHEESSLIAKKILEKAIRDRNNIILDKVSGDPDGAETQINKMKGLDYHTEARFVDRPIPDALAGMAQRFENGPKRGEVPRWVDPEVLAKGHFGAAASFHRIAPLVDEASLDSAPAGSRATTRTYENGTVYNQDAWEAHQEKAAEHGRLRDDRGGLEETGRGGQAGIGTAGRNATPGSENNVGAGSQGVSGQPAGQATQEHPATVPAQEQGQVGLHLAENAPPKDKPVILVQGGAYNPSHDGHVAAMQDAHDLLTGAGYTVDGHVVAPTADKLLAKKLGDADRLPVEDRANIATAQYPKEINGKPVDVQTGPAAEVEAMDRKPKRSDLAKNIQRQYPNHTVINVTGEDAGVPGAPADQPAALYQGDPGTSHEGINYITVPRVGGHSSTQIREALKSGEPIPGMNPEAERLYREAMAKKQQGTAPAPAPEEAPAQGDMFGGAPPERGTPAPGDVGRMDPNEISVDPHRFQYKMNTDTEGVSPLLKETKVWNPDLAGVVSVWRDPADGKTYVVNGHHRVELAKRLGVSDVVVRHIEANTAKEARGIGASQNIAEGRGTAIDAAKYFRDLNLGPEDLKSRGISLSEGKAKDGLALSRLDPGIFDRVVKGDLRQGQAIKIGEATDDPAVQTSIVDMLDRDGGRMTDGQLAETIRLTMNAPQATESTMNLFGEQHITRSLGREKGEVSDYIQQQIKREKQTFGFVTKAGRAQELSRAGNVIEVEKSRDIATRATQAAEVYNKLSERTGDVDDILNDAARRLSRGENGSTVKAEAYDKIRAAIGKVLGSGEEGNP